MQGDGITAHGHEVAVFQISEHPDRIDFVGSSPETILCSASKVFVSAAKVTAGIELLRRIHDRQFALSRLRRNGQAAPAIWNAVVAPYMENANRNVTS